MAVDMNRVWFLRGVLAALASSGQVVHYSEIRRLCRLSQQQLGEYLGEARKPMAVANQPDFCAVVVRDVGWPGDGWSEGPAGTDANLWAAALREAHTYWRARRDLDNTEFTGAYGALPELPGL